MFATTSLSLLAGLGAAAISSDAADPQVWHWHGDHILGTSLDMTVVGSGDAEGWMALTAARAEIDRLDAVLSGWRDDSELALLNATADMAVSPDLFRVVSACERWRMATGGAFDARQGALHAAWRRADDRLSAERIATLTSTGPVVLDPNAHTIGKPAGMILSVDGLAKGYVIDAALAAARRGAPSARGLMLDIGGDLRCWGQAPGGGAWRVGIVDPAHRADNAPPASVVRIDGRALAVSGPGARDRQVGGANWSHLIDPASGAPAPRVQAAVLARTAADADALATALAVLRPRAGIDLAESVSGAEAMVIAEGGLRFATSGWGALEGPALACQAALPTGFSIDIDYEIPRIAAGNYRKPYVVVWVTDAERNLVKTLVVMGDRQDYMADNYVWWRRYGRKEPGVLDSMARPTRAPGRYTVRWDGTDQAGARVPQGSYTINIEAAREHGGHSLQTIQVTLGAAPISAAAPSADELGAARVRYGRAQ